jgi:hypothetical protein
MLLENDSSLQAVTQRIAPSQHCRARLRTPSLNVKLFKCSSCPCKRIGIGRVDVRSMKADVFPAQVIC